MDVLLGIALSSHIGFQFDYNEIHPQIRLENEKYAIGAFYNSEENISLYGAKRIIINNRTSIELGISSGYNYENYPVIPFARGVYEQNENIRYFIAPSVEEIRYNDGTSDLNTGFIIGVELFLR